MPAPHGHPEPTGAEHRPLPWRGRPILLGNLEVQRSRNQVTCTVEISHDGATFSGTDREMDSPTGRARAAARATLAAAQAAASNVSFGLEGALLTELFGRRFAIVSVEAASGRRRAHLAGIVAIERSIEESACLAALSAVERWATD